MVAFKNRSSYLFRASPAVAGDANQKGLLAGKATNNVIPLAGVVSRADD